MILSPVVFGLKHLVGTTAMIILIIIVLYYTLKNTNLNRRRVLQISAVVLVGLELVKYLYVGRLHGHLPVYMYPLNLCSYSLYVMPLVAFGRGRFVEIIKPFAYSVGLLAACIVFIYPVTVLGSTTFWFPIKGDWLPFHSFFYHATMLYFSLYLVLSGEFTPTWKNAYMSYIGLIIAATVSGLTNLVLETDFMFLREGNSSPIQFIYTSWGYLPYLIVNILLAVVLIVISYAPFAIRARKRVPSQVIASESI